MANGLNRAYLLGNLGADPELRVTSGGNSVLTMNIACSETYLDRNRVRQERTEWVRVVVWGRRAEALAKFLRKGAKVMIEGKVQTTSWEDREGIKRYRTEVVAHNVILGGGAKARSAPKDPEDRRPSRRDDQDDDRGGSADSGGYDNQDDFGGGGDDDIPF